MPSDSSIYSLIRPAQPPTNPIEQYGQTLQLKNLMGQSQMQERAMRDDALSRQAAIDSGGDPTKYGEALFKAGLPKQAMEAAKAGLDVTQTRGNIEKNKQEILAKSLLNHREQLVDVNDPVAGAKWIMAGFNDPNLSPIMQKSGSPEELIAKIPQDPKGFDQWKMQRALGLGKFYEMLSKENTSSNRGEYSTPVYDQNGRILAFNNRKQGELTVPKNPFGGTEAVIGAAQSPSLQGKLTGAKKFGEEVGKETADVGRGTDALTSISDARKMLNQGIYTGFYADINKTIAKATPGADKTKAANTEQYLSHIGNVVIPRLKEFGGNDTVEELKYLQNVMAGNTRIEEKSIRGILDSTERKLKAKMKRLSKQAETVGLGEQAAIGAPVNVNPSDLSDDEIRRELGL